MGANSRVMVLNSRIQHATDIADNTDVDFINVPAYSQIVLYSLKVFTVVKATTASGKLEVVDASNNILLSATTTHTNGTVASQSQTVPVTYTNNTSSDTMLKLRTDVAAGAAVNYVARVTYEFPKIGT